MYRRGRAHLVPSSGLAPARQAKPLTHYGKFLSFRRHVETEVMRSFSSVPTMVREERQDLRLYGQKCADCGAVSYPRRHFCWQRSSKNRGEYRISRRGTIFTFAKDHLVPSPDPPTVMVSADLGGWGPLLRPAHRLRPGCRHLRAARGAVLPPHPRGRGDHQLLLEVPASVENGEALGHEVVVRARESSP